MKKLMLSLVVLVSFSARADSYLFGGLDAGVSGLSANIGSEVDKFGVDFAVKALFSQEWESFVVDLGVGYSFDRVVGGPSSRRVTIETKSGFVEVSPRYVFTEGWQLGPVGVFQFGSEVGMAETLAGSAKTAFYGGLQLNHEWGSESTRYRIGLRGLMDISIPDRTHWKGQAFFQIGFPIFQGGKEEEAPRKPETVTTKTTTEEFKEESFTMWADPEPAAPRIKEYDDGAFRIEKRGVSTLIVTAYSTALHFNTARHTLSPESTRLFQKLAGVLREHSGDWTRARVDGHADERGSDAYNKTLSQRRAYWISHVISGTGIAESRLYSKGFGEAQPISLGHNEASWVQNRRVEVVIYNVTNRELVIEAIKSIRARNLASSRR